MKVKAAHLKRLTLPDLALRLLHDPILKQALAREAIAMLAPGSAGYEAELQSRFDEALLRILGPENRRYHISCSSCALNEVLETANWRSAGAKVRCCSCDVEATVGMPEHTAIWRCGCCGTELTIRLVEKKA